MSGQKPHIELSAEELAQMIEGAAQRGATKALAALGLHDEDAGRDVAELRDLLTGWREFKRGARNEMGRWITRILFISLVAIAGTKYAPIILGSVVKH